MKNRSEGFRSVSRMAGKVLFFPLDNLCRIVGRGYIQIQQNEYFKYNQFLSSMQKYFRECYMNPDKRERLKEYSGKNLYANLVKSRTLIRDNLLNENLQTKKTINHKISKILSCSEKEFSAYHYDVDSITGEIERDRKIVLYNNNCNNFLICPMCARKRKEIILSVYSEKIKELALKYPCIYMITYTVKDTPKFNKGFKILTDGIRRFRRMGQKRRDGKNGYGEAGKIKAALGCAETTEGSNSGQWHTHIHQIAFTDKPLNYQVYDAEKKKEIIRFYNENYHSEPEKDDLVEAVMMKLIKDGKVIPVSKLSMEWYFSTRKTSTNIDVSPLKVSGRYYRIKKNKKYIQLNDDNISIVLKEIVKYATKINDLSPEKLLELLINKENKRFLYTWGELRNIGNEREIMEDEELLGMDYIIDVFCYDFEKGKYVYGDEQQEKYANELYNNRDKLKDYRIKLLKALAYKNELRKTLKTEILLHGITNKNRDRIIEDVDSIDTAFRYYNNLLFRKVVKIPCLHTDRKKIKKLKGKERYFFGLFMALKLF